MPLTKKQRDWIKNRRNDGRCQHMWKEDGKWKQCPHNAETCELHAHHIVSQRFSAANFTEGFDGDGPENIITLCCEHHIGKKCKCKKERKPKPKRKRR